MWSMIIAHPISVVAIIGLAIIIVASIVGIIASAVNSGKEVEAGVGATGLKLKFGAGNKKNEKTEEDITANIVRDAALLSSTIINWKESLSRQLEKMQADVVSSCIRYAVSRIDNLVNIAKLEYPSIIKRKKGELSVEDNYQNIICGFLMDQVKEYFKNQVCGAIREDHFEEKTDAEIKAVGDNCYLGAKLIFEDKAEVLQKDILLEIDGKYGPKIKKEADEIIEITEEKYKELKKSKKEIIEMSECRFKTELKIKFPMFTEETIDVLVSYYS